jgi:hypothetical protein
LISIRSDHRISEFYLLLEWRDTFIPSSRNPRQFQKCTHFSRKSYHERTTMDLTLKPLLKHRPEVELLIWCNTWWSAQTLAGYVFGSLNNILVAHIERRIMGTVDELIRHSVSRIKCIHFVSNVADAAKRLFQMGEIESPFYIRLARCWSTLCFSDSLGF